MKPTNIAAPDYFHKVVDCQWACPAHTPVPEYIRLIAEGRYSDAYMINWRSNVFPGILGRTCDRPCEPACRRGRVEKEPVAICRLKRVAADFKDDIRGRLPKPSHEEWQAHRAGRRRPRLARGRARSRPARLPLHRVRPGPQGRRHDADADSEIPPARRRGRRGDRLHPQPRHRVQRRQAHRQHEEAAGGELRRDLRRLRRAARPRARHSRPQGSRQEHPHRHRLAVQRLVRPRHLDQQARHRARRRQHRDGLLPHRAPPRRRGRQGDRALRLRGDEGVALGEGGRRPRGHSDPQFHGAEGVHPRQRQADRRGVREGQGRVRRQGPAQPRADRRAGSDRRLRRRAGGGRPGERLPLDRARRRHRVRQVGHAQGRSRRPWPRPTRRCSSAATRPSARRTSSGRWRTATTPRCRSTRCCSGEDITERPLPDVQISVAEDGHPRVELRQRHLQRQALPGAASRQGDRAEGHPRRGRARL